MGYQLDNRQQKALNDYLKEYDDALELAEEVARNVVPVAEEAYKKLEEIAKDLHVDMDDVKEVFKDWFEW